MQLATIGAGTVLYRVHRAANGPAFFDNSPAGRFNPPADYAERFGTLYLSLSPEGAFVETLGRTRYLDPAAIAARALTTCTFARTLQLFDVTDRANRLHYDDLDLAAHAVSTNPDYTTAQRLAAHVWDDDIDGIISPSRHDNAVIARSVALFGPPGQQPAETFATTATAAIPHPLINEMISQFGFEVLPATPLP